MKCCISSIWSNHDDEFQNVEFKKIVLGVTYCTLFCCRNSITKQGSGTEKYIPWRDSKVMLNETNFSKYFWPDAVSNICFVMNSILIRSILKLTSYEIYKGRKPNKFSPSCIFLWYFTYKQIWPDAVSKCVFLSNKKDALHRFDVKVDEGIFLWYFTSSKAFSYF